MLKRSFYLFLGLTLLAPASAFAVGSGAFENASFSAKQIATGGAVTAQADEPAAISYNPAGLAYLDGIQGQYNSGFISATTYHSGSSDSHTKSAGNLHYVPTAYVSINPGKYLNNRLALGFGVDSPFGLSNKFNSNESATHYTGYSNYIKMYALKPVMAIKIADSFSIGGGPVYYRLYDFGGVQAYPNSLLGFPLADGQIRANLSGNTWGWQLGALFKPRLEHQFGFYFRSPSTIFTRGQVEVENATVGGNFKTGANAKLDLPLNLTWAYAYKPNEKLTVETDFGYTRWSALKRIYINADPVNSSDDALLRGLGTGSSGDKDYSDGFSLQLGGEYKFTKRFALRAGSYFYWAVIPQDHFTPSIADTNRLAFSFGPSYKITENLTLDMAYLAAFGLSRKINNDLSESLGTSVDGKYSTVIHSFYITLSYKIGEIFNR